MDEPIANLPPCLGSAATKSDRFPDQRRGNIEGGKKEGKNGLTSVTSL